MDLREHGHKIFSQGFNDFESMALEIFRFQYAHNPMYHEYVDALKVNDASVRSITQIPFLPIRFFKSHAVKTKEFDPQIIFESSGTTGSVNSRHLIREIALYEKSFTHGFERVYGLPADWCIIGLLPSYLERNNSSLVYMVNGLIRQSGHSHSGFYLNEFEKLSAVLKELESAGQKTILIGVTFALLDFAERYPLNLKHTTIIETGGMKGRREEMIRAEVHDRLKKSFGVSTIHSEYGMTELLSQAYSKGSGIFHCPPWMKVLIRDDEDPLSVWSSEFGVRSREGAGSLESGVGSPGNGLRSPDSKLTTPYAGALNVIDLANVNSCSFVATDDVGKLYADGSFEVLGRMDQSDIRGCSLMVV